MEWTPLIEKKNGSPYMEKLREIAAALQKNVKRVKRNAGVTGGKAGIVLFFFYYAHLTGEEEYLDLAHQLIDEIFAEVGKKFNIHTFSAGLAGVGWMLEHLAQNGFIEANTDDILENLDPFLHQAMILDVEKNNYDFLHGAVGIGTYFLSRAAKKECRDYLHELIDHLDKIKHVHKGRGIAWESLLVGEEKEVKGYDMSLSHGNSCIMVLLAKILGKEIDVDKVSSLLSGVVGFLLANSLDTQKYPYTFPNWISEKSPFGPSRLGWCYGDLGIGISLWQAAQSTGNKEWEKKAIAALLNTTGRRALEENWVRDAGLCHGTAGITHIYNRLYHYTGIDTFKETALFWLEQTKKMAFHKDGFAGYKTWYSEAAGGWGAEPGLLTGVAGIGLMFISCISPMEPRWDRCLLLS